MSSFSDNSADSGCISQDNILAFGGGGGGGAAEPPPPNKRLMKPEPDPDLSEQFDSIGAERALLLHLIIGCGGAAENAIICGAQ